MVFKSGGVVAAAKQDIYKLDLYHQKMEKKQSLVWAN